MMIQMLLKRINFLMVLFGTNIYKKIEPKIKPDLDNSLDLKFFSKKFTDYDVAKFKINLNVEYEHDEKKGFSYSSNSLIP